MIACVPRSFARTGLAATAVLQEPDMKKNLEAQGMVPSGGTPQRFGERIRKDYDRWVKVVREQNIKPE